MQALIGMSGGVDSSVAAYLCMQSGFDCQGATMRLYTGQDGVPCCTDRGIEDAQAVAAHLNISFHVLDLSAEFARQVMEAFADCYEAGLTPNPCVVCNRHLKFGAFLQEAQKLGCDYIATGHYARIRRGENGRYQLCRAIDRAKDQSYFLYAMTQHQLAHTLFPLGELTKEEARKIAEAQGFINAQKRDSQDICFVPDGDYVAFLERWRKRAYAPGAFLDAQGKTVGTHKGAAAYTLGQRKGLGLAMGTPVYVCGKDMQANTVTVGPESLLFHDTLIARDVNWVSVPAQDAPFRATAKARSRMQDVPATVYPEEGSIRVVFDAPQRALTPGQAVVLYDGDLVLAGGTIDKIL